MALGPSGVVGLDLYVSEQTMATRSLVYTVLPIYYFKKYFSEKSQLLLKTIEENIGRASASLAIKLRYFFDYSFYR